MTSGYELLFVTKGQEAVKLTLDETRQTELPVAVDSSLRYLKATADSLFFIDFDGQAHMIVQDEEAT